LDHDAREYHSASSKFILEILLAQARARKLRKDIVTPILFLVAGEDRIVDPSATKKAFNGLKAGDKTLVEFPGMYHALSIELGRDSVFEELLRWTEKKTAP
jgi:alpha-beta hydrolase superfamily lysophospholipase